jgi:hypothetical protein
LGWKDTDITAGDVFTLYNETTMTDGRIYQNGIVLNDSTTIHNVTTDIMLSTASQSFTTSIVVNVE